MECSANRTLEVGPSRKLEWPLHATVRSRLRMLACPQPVAARDAPVAYWPPARGEVAEPGLRRTPGERVNSEGFRGFKSPPLRQPAWKLPIVEKSQRTSRVCRLCAILARPENRPFFANAKRRRLRHGDTGAARSKTLDFSKLSRSLIIRALRRLSHSSPRRHL